MCAFQLLSSTWAETGPNEENQGTGISLMNPYLPGEQELERFSATYPGLAEFKNFSFLDVPLSYDSPSGPSMKIFYRLASQLDSAPERPTVLYFYGGPGGASYQSKLEIGLEDFNVIYMDQRGTGFSRPPEFAQLQNPEFFNSEFIAKDAALLVNKLGLKKVTVYGHSYGTIPATIFASLFPDLTQAVVLEGVVFSGQVDLWSAPHRIKVLQRMFDAYPKELKQKILDLSQSGKVSKSWFSLLSQQEMYQNNFQKSLRKKLEDLFALPENEQIQKLIKYTPSSRFTLDSVFFGAYMFHHIACQELSASIPGSTWEATFVNGKLTPEASFMTPLCLMIPGLASRLDRTYEAVNYPLRVPVTYFQGTWDGATVAPAAVHHFKAVPQGQAQLILINQAGHGPLINCLDGLGNAGPNYDPAVSAVCGGENSKKIIQQAFLGLPITKDQLKSLSSVSPWVMTQKP